MPFHDKQILIIDEQGFSRICSAILEEIVGYETDVVSNANELPSKLCNSELKLIVTSYPYGAFFFDEIRKTNIPTIILSDNIDGRLIDMIGELRNAYCMIKPIDYEKFKTLVRQVVSGGSPVPGRSGIV